MKARNVLAILVMTVATTAHADRIPTKAEVKAACTFGGSVVLLGMTLKDQGKDFDTADRAVRTQLVEGKPNREDLMMAEQMLMVELWADHFAGHSPEGAAKMQVHECVNNFARMYPEIKW